MILSKFVISNGSGDKFKYTTGVNINKFVAKFTAFVEKMERRYMRGTRFLFKYIKKCFILILIFLSWL